MASINDVYGSGATLKADDLPAGVQVPVTIEKITPKDFDDGNKLEIKFAGKEKLLICNKTNAGRIAAEHGEDYEAWTGKRIFLQRDMCEFNGQSVQCVRVVPFLLVRKDAAPALAVATVDASTGEVPDDQVPF